jgi:hypothetical protein
MRLLLTLAAVGSLAACSHNHANVDTAPETGRAVTDTPKTSGSATGSATGSVKTSGDTAQASGSAQGTATGSVDTTTVRHDSL